jgi:hypothetical protein
MVMIFKILYHVGGTCWDYRLSHSIFHTLYCRLHRRYYNRSVTNGSLTNCVDRSRFPSTLLTVSYFCWCPTIHRRLLAVVASSLANYWLLSSPAGPPTLWLQTALRRRQLTSTPVTVGIQPKVAFFGPSRGHLAQPFRNALSRVGYWGNICCPFTMHSSGFILEIANRYHGYNIVSLRRSVAATVYPAVG